MTVAAMDDTVSRSWMFFIRVFSHPSRSASAAVHAGLQQGQCDSRRVRRCVSGEGSKAVFVIVVARRGRQIVFVGDRQTSKGRASLKLAKQHDAKKRSC